LAQNLAQPFPVFALFGPANIEEMRISLEALDIELAPDEGKWLNQGALTCNL